MLNHLNAQLQKINDLELEYIRHRLIYKSGMDSTKVHFAIMEYKKFLALCLIYKNESHTMGGDVDVVWHEHILHTRNYAHDCESLLGFFLHHTPNSYSIPNAVKDNTLSLNDTIEKIFLLFGSVNLESWGVEVKQNSTHYHTLNERSDVKILSCNSEGAGADYTNTPNMIYSLSCGGDGGNCSSEYKPNVTLLTAKASSCNAQGEHSCHS